MVVVVVVLVFHREEKLKPGVTLSDIQLERTNVSAQTFYPCIDGSVISQEQPTQLGLLKRALKIQQS